MGRKVHPMGFRIGVIRDWQAKWYADKHYGEFLQEDLKIRQAIQSRYAEAAISQVDIDRQANRVWVTVSTARPGIVIGRGGQRVDETRLYLEKLIGKRVQLNIQEVQQAELDAYLVARTVADQIEHRVSYRRAMKQAIFRTIQAGAKGIKISCSGRLGGADIARRQVLHEGRVPLQTLRADIDYGFAEASTSLSQIGVKVWIYKGDILSEPKMVEVEEAAIELVAGEDMEAASPVEAEEKLEPKEMLTETVDSGSVEAVSPAEAEEKLEQEKTLTEATESTPLELEEKDATTEAGEIPQDS